ncbi:MAG: glycosyltransferase [Bdellovibrionales bacterium]|nr:glycosyltransferase [Bdellovibrionales bacterium]
MKRVAVLFFSEAHYWKSCQGLISDLAACYDRAFSGAVDFFGISHDPSTWEATAQKIAAGNYSVISFIDFRFYLPFWTETLKKYLKSQVTWGWHTDGSFGNRMPEWISLSKVLKSESVVVFASSTAHQGFVEGILDGENLVRRFPFPFVASRQIGEESDGRKWRQKWGIRDDQKVYLYTGRVSYQKNVHHLVNLFSEWKSKDAVLVIYGKSDNGGCRQNPQGVYLHYASEIFFESLNQAEASGVRVIYPGFAEEAELNHAYLGSDVFVSLSTSIGEDFGRSVAEALSLGLSCVLTAWGGYKDFGDIPGVRTIPIQLKDEGLDIDTRNFFQQMEVAPEKKEKVAEAFLRKWSLDAQAELLRKLYDKPGFFEGISSKGKNYFKALFTSESEREYFDLLEPYLHSYWK